MNYLKTYVKICRKAQERIIDKSENYEKHHVFPVSIYGENSFTVVLSLREHYVVHWLLWKAFIKRYGASDEKTRKMAIAFHWMIYGKNKKHRVDNYSSRVYESARLAAIMSKKGNIREDMLGKKFFGATQQRILDGIKKQADSRRGKKINYPKQRKLRGNHTIETVSIMKEKRESRYEKYRKMSKDEFTSWLSRYKIFSSDGRINGNILAAIRCRSESLVSYYPDLTEYD